MWSMLWAIGLGCGYITEQLGYHTFYPFQACTSILWPISYCCSHCAVAYWLRLPENAKIHDVFHVGLPKKFVGTPLAEVAQLPLVVHGRVVPTPQHAIQACLNRGVWELLIHWQGSAPAEATRESLPSFIATYSNFQLEDKLFLDEGGNVTDAFVGKTYRRRKSAGEKKGLTAVN